MAGATSIPSLSLEELTAQSETIVTGQINRSWADWDTDHKYIWTHYELSVASALKGSPGSTVILSEPGGVVGIQGMSIAGSVAYQPGDQVLVFLQRMPNGYLRTTGWSQGKFTIDQTGLVHSEAGLGGVEVPDAKGRVAATHPRSLNGMSVTQVRARIQAKGGAQ